MNKAATIFLAILLLPLSLRADSTASSPRKEFIEARSAPLRESGDLEQLKKNRMAQESDQMDRTNLIQSSRQIYKAYSSRVRVPGFISASPLPQLAKIVGPVGISSFFRQGDTIYARWSGAPIPKAGERFSVFSPALVTQSLLNPTEFSAISPPGPGEDLPTDTRLAGYFYETTGRIKVIRVRDGLVEGNLEQITGIIRVGDELMMILPKLDELKPVNGGIQLSAAVVFGSPHDRLSTTKGSFIYINRGSRDGIRVGRVFESVENVSLDQAVGGSAPLLSNGEATVIHTTDAYSTAMITKQFDVIRMGSLLRTQQAGAPISRDAAFEGFGAEQAFEKENKMENQIPEVPDLDNLPGGADSTLPEPRKKQVEQPQLSELDSMEKSLKAHNLTPTEKSRLNKLSQQEKLKADNLKELDEDTGTPGTPSVENSFKAGKKSAKKDPKAKKKNKNDEEELNQLMMQN